MATETFPAQKTHTSTEPSKISRTTQPSATRFTDDNGAVVEITLEQIPAERRRAWAELLTEAYTALMREIPTGNRLKLMIRAFEQICSRIPTHLLRPAYVRSMEIRDDEGRPSFWDSRLLLAAYEINDWSGYAAGGQIAKVSTSTAENCEMCLGVGMREFFDRTTGRSLGYAACDHVPAPAEIYNEKIDASL